MAEGYGHPASWRLHRAHPALGLEELEVELLMAPKPYELGAAWLALEPAERRRREADFATALWTGARSGWEIEPEVGDKSRALGVRMDRWKAPAFERELLDRVWEEARRRDAAAPREQLEARRRGEIGRTLRAHVRVAWSKHPVRIVAAAVWLLAAFGLPGLDWI